MSVVDNGIDPVFNLHDIEVVFQVINLDQGFIANPVEQFNLRGAMTNAYFVCHGDQLKS
jgi:hypothetical protein